MTEYTIFKKSHVITAKEGKETVIKLEFSIKDEDYQEFVNKLTNTKGIKVVLDD